MDTLVLNATYEPLKVVSWQRAVTLMYAGKVEVLATHDREIRAVTFSFKMPAVVRLWRFVKRQKRDAEHVPFCRANIYARDGYTCQYCGNADLPLEELTFDHVRPVAQGGKRTWENIVTACIDCNRRKDARTPAEAGMTLRKAPKKPKPTPIFRIGIGIRTAPASWREFLYWNVELEE